MLYDHSGISRWCSKLPLEHFSFASTMSFFLEVKQIIFEVAIIFDFLFIPFNEVKWSKCLNWVFCCVVLHFIYKTIERKQVRLHTKLNLAFPSLHPSIISSASIKISMICDLVTDVISLTLYTYLMYARHWLSFVEVIHQRKIPSGQR